MKPKEILKNDYFNGYSSCQKIIRTYKDQDCVVAYTKYPIGTLFIIKGAKKFFGYAFNNYSKHWCEMGRFNLIEIYKDISIDKQKVIVDKTLWTKLQADILIAEL